MHGRLWFYSSCLSFKLQVWITFCLLWSFQYLLPLMIFGEEIKLMLSAIPFYVADYPVLATLSLNGWLVTEGDYVLFNTVALWHFGKWITDTPNQNLFWWELSCSHNSLRDALGVCSSLDLMLQEVWRGQMQKLNWLLTRYHFYLKITCGKPAVLTLQQRNPWGNWRSVWQAILPLGYWTLLLLKIFRSTDMKPTICNKSVFHSQTL